MQSLPVIVMTLQGENAVTRVRDLVGVTDPSRQMKELSVSNLAQM